MVRLPDGTATNARYWLVVALTARLISACEGIRITDKETIMRVLNGLLGVVLGILAVVVWLVGLVVCVTAILIPLGVPVIKLRSRLLTLVGDLMAMP